MTDHRGTETQRDGLTERAIGAGIEVHRHLGPGCLNPPTKSVSAGS